MSLYRCKRCGTISYRPGVRLWRCPACGLSLSLPGMAEAEVRGRLYPRPQYVDRVKRPPPDRENHDDTEPRVPTR
jgi:ribosomal protein L37AE/L43A